MKVLIEAGANPNNIGFEGSTPLFGAAFNGHVEVVKELLRVKADPRLARTQRFGSVSPLDVAAEHGHSSVVRELTQLGVSEGGGGPSGGVQALQFAGKNQHLDAMIVLADAGVVDTGAALIFAADYGKEASVKFLLQRNGGKTTGEISYVNFRDPFGRTALVAAITCRCYTGARIARSLVDAGADTSSALRITDSPGGGAIFDDTPLALTARNLREIGLSRIRGPATEERFQQLEGIRRLLLQVEAVHAVSWLWPNDPPFVVREASEGMDEVKSQHYSDPDSADSDVADLGAKGSKAWHVPGHLVQAFVERLQRTGCTWKEGFSSHASSANAWPDVWGRVQAPDLFDRQRFRLPLIGRG